MSLHFGNVLAILASFMKVPLCSLRFSQPSILPWRKLPRISLFKLPVWPAKVLVSSMCFLVVVEPTHLKIDSNWIFSPNFRDDFFLICSTHQPPSSFWWKTSFKKTPSSQSTQNMESIVPFAVRLVLSQRLVFKLNSFAVQSLTSWWFGAKPC